MLPWVDVATGSLGQGLPIGVGMAIAGRYLDRLPYRVWVLCGDSELAEGSMWEAFEHASHYALDNLTAVVDVNRLGQRGETMVGRDTGVLAERARAFGWHAIEIDGHDVEEIDKAYSDAEALTGRPTAIFASTLKGKGVSAVEDKNGWHGKPLDDPDAAIAELGGVRDLRLEPRLPDAGEPHRVRDGPLELPRYELGEEVATRKAYGDALAAVGAARGDVVAAGRRGVELDASPRSSRRRIPSATSRCTSPSSRWSPRRSASRRAAGGRSRRASRPSSAARYDFVRMAAISRATICLSGSHAGVSIGEDGPSQMALEDIAIAARRPRLHGAAPVRRQPDGEARGGDGRSGGHLVPAHAAAGDARALRAGRGVRGRREPCPAFVG